LIIARHKEKRKGQGKEIIGNERGKGMGSASDDAFRDLQSQRSNNPTIKVWADAVICISLGLALWSC
jgi:hypothetical protein